MDQNGNVRHRISIAEVDQADLGLQRKQAVPVGPNGWRCQNQRLGQPTLMATDRAIANFTASF